MRKMRLAALLLGLSALVSTSAFAQQTTGHITGRVLDAQGAAVPGATVTARNQATGFTRTVPTDEEGVYRLQALPVGNYDLVTELSGFSTVEQKGIIVNVGQTISVDFELRVTAVAETVTVTPGCVSRAGVAKSPGSSSVASARLTRMPRPRASRTIVAFTDASPVAAKTSPAPNAVAPIRQARDFTTGVEIQVTTSASPKARKASERFGMSVITPRKGR